MKTIVKVKHIKQSASKVRFVLDTIKGTKVDNALDRLSLSNKKASSYIYKAVKSAISNLMIKESEINQSDLFITEAYVDEGPSMKRFRPRAMGRASRILKRTSHLTVIIGNKG